MVHARTCDGTDPGEVAEFVAGLGIVDVLVNNAGGNTDFDRAEPDDLAGLAASWQANFAANLLSAVLMTEATRPKLASGGTVIGLGSIAADTGSGTGSPTSAGTLSSRPPTPVAPARRKTLRPPSPSSPLRRPGTSAGRRSR